MVAIAALPVRDDARYSSIIGVHMQHYRAPHCALFARRYTTPRVLDSLLERNIEKVPFRDSCGEVFVIDSCGARRVPAGT